MSMKDKFKASVLGAVLSSVCISTALVADDTEIFFGQSADAFNTNPNVLFVIDTSGSMSWFDTGVENSRMDRLKVAMRVLLRESSSFNVGLMGFQGSNRGGSIRYPVGDLEGDSGSLCPDGICPDERVVVKPSSGNDDATQNDDTLVVTLNDQELIMADVEETTQVTVDTTANDINGSAFATAISAENELDGGATDTRAVTSTTQWFFNGIDGSEDDRYAYRFDNVAIPKGATVTSAKLHFTKTSELAQVGNLSALIKLEVKPNPDPLPDGANEFPTIAERLAPGHSTLGVAWNNIPPDTTGTTTTDEIVNGPIVTSPDVSEIVNQIINLPNWESGNALSFIIDPVDEYTPSSADMRLFKGLDAPGNSVPSLSFTYSETVETDITSIETKAAAHLDEITEQNTDTVARNLDNKSARTFFASSTYYPRKLAFRFEDLDIPNDAIIQTATLILTGAEDGSESDPADWVADASTVPDTPIPPVVIAPDLGGATPEGDNDADLGDIVTPENILSININAEKTGTPAAYDNDPLRTRELTTEFLAWEDVEILPDEQISSPNLATVVAAVINGDQWTEGNDLSLVLSAPNNYNNVLENSALIQTAKGADVPELHITWKASDEIDTTLQNSQTTAIRFQNVHVPPGAEIKSAKLVFNASKATIGDTELEISAEEDAASAPLTAASNNIGERARTPKRVTWDVEPWDVPNVEYDSPDIKDVIQSVTDLPEWCGGNPLTVFLKKSAGDDSRHAISYDQNQVSAPTLEITYAPESVPTGAYCSNATLLSSILSSADDAVQDTVSNTVDTSGASLDTVNPVSGNPQVIGLRFASVAVPKDAAIISATLELVPEKEITQAQTFEIKAVSSSDNPPFNNSDAKILDASRPTYDTTVTATVTPRPATTSVFSVDVESLISEKTSDDGWLQGQQMVLTVDALDDIAQSFYSFNGNEVNTPRLIIYYQSERDTPGTRVRDNLIEIVDDLVPQSGTPVVSSYYEAAQYFLGESVDYGLQRGNQGYWDKFHRVSHPGSYTNGIVNRESNCVDADLNADACITETITPENGLTPTYVSPIESACQQNHIVLLSDGAPTSNTAAQKIRNLTGDNSCMDIGSKECGRELAQWLLGNDIDPTLDGVQNVTTHTIGFALDDPQFLQDLAADGGGNFYAADSSAELLNAFQNIFINVSKTDTSFVAPSATVSQANRLKNRDDIYFSLFKPEGTARWAGNLKRYRLGADDGGTADIYDFNGVAAVNPDTGRFYPTARSFWSAAADGDSVLLGGAAENLSNNGQAYTDRKVYTYTGENKDLNYGFYNDLYPENTYIKREWLKLPSNLLADTDYVEDMLNWAHGKDVYDIDGDGDTEEGRNQMGDPLHSQPLLVNYAGDRSVVHLLTNEGFLHAIDHEHGTENFSFMPKELLPNIRKNYENEPTRNRTYGLDGGMTVWIQDENKNGVVDPLVDKAYLYFGMRRGGNLYYAIDISDPDDPQYMWSIQGGAITDAGALDKAEGNFEELGDTWSKPIKTKIYDGSIVRDVLVFGAGYGTNQDPIATVEVDPTNPGGPDQRQTRSEDAVGRGFFVIDANDGSIIWQTNPSDYDTMQYSVPGDLRVIDINFDGLADQIYFGDMGGQVWRFDYNNDMVNTDTAAKRMTGGMIASFAGDTPEEARRFYYPPDIALLSIDGTQQLSISIGSGWRAHPLDDVVEDRFYNFRMTQVYGAPVDKDGTVRYPVITEKTTGMETLDESDVARTASKDDKGWILPMTNGEKVLSSSVTIDGNIVFTSYVPSATTQTCSAAVGSGNVYLLDAATGNPVRNLDEDSAGGDAGSEAGEENLDANDRRRALPHSGIPPEPSVLFPESGKATAFVGRDKLDEVDIPALKQRTFWQEHMEESIIQSDGSTSAQ